MATRVTTNAPASTYDPTILRWEMLTKRRFDEIDRANAIVLVTCSPLEVHGPHVSERHRDREILELPYIFAASDPLPHPGSLFFHPQTTVKVLVDLGRSLAAQGFKNVFVSNFHGSPRHFLSIEKACDKVAREREINMACIFSILITRLTGGGSELYDALGDLPGVEKENLVGDAHGGLVETSQLLALHPEWVERDYGALPRRTVDLWLDEQGQAKPAAERGKPPGLLAMVRSFQAGLAFFRADTYAGAPGAASPELGHQILDTLSKHGGDTVSEILDGKLPPQQWHSPLWPKRFLFTNTLMVRLFNRLLRIPDGIA